MANEFSSIEIRLLRSLLSKKGDAAIAVLLDRPEQEVSAKIHELTGGKSPAQKRLDERNRKKQEKLLKKQQSLLQHQQQRELKKAKQDFNSGKHKELKKLLASQSAERELKKRLREEPLYETKQVDYSQLRVVRIDKRTVILIKPNDDPQKAKQKYFNRLKTRT